MNGKCLVAIGASSYLASSIMEELSSSFDHIIGTYCSKKPSFYNNSKKIKLLKLNLNSKKSIDNFFKKKFFNNKNLYFINFSVKIKDQLLYNLEYEEIKKIIEFNITTNIYLTKKIISKMIPNKFGRIIFLSSTKALKGDPGSGLYSMSKSSLIGLNNTISVEYNSFNIKSNIISLGYFKSNLWNRLNEKKRNELLNQTLTKKLIQKEDLLKTILFIFFGESIVRSTIYLDGGI